MTFPSLKNAQKLKEIIKETTGDDVSVTEVYRVWHYLNKILPCTGLWRGRKKTLPPPNQLTLFTKHLKKR